MFGLDIELMKQKFDLSNYIKKVNYHMDPIGRAQPGHILFMVLSTSFISNGGRIVFD